MHINSKWMSKRSSSPPWFGTFNFSVLIHTAQGWGVAQLHKEFKPLRRHLASIGIGIGEGG